MRVLEHLSFGRIVHLGLHPPGLRDLGGAQSLQNPLIKEYTLNHIWDPITIYKVYSLIKGFWRLWVLPLSPQNPARGWTCVSNLGERRRFFCCAA